MDVSTINTVLKHYHNLNVIKNATHTLQLLMNGLQATSLYIDPVYPSLTYSATSHKRNTFNDIARWMGLKTLEKFKFELYFTTIHSCPIIKIYI